MPLESGTRLGPYEVIASIGAGGMGEVYRARDTKLDRDVALKVLPEHLASDPEALGRFEREAKAVAALSHPNILAIHDFGTHEGTAYAVTELLDGETLRARLESGALPQKKVVQIAADIARGLAAAHDKLIVHRDLKPENVFITADGQVKILDFGLAKTVSGSPDDGRTELRSALPTELQTDPGMVMGTVGYMSPEQVKGEPAELRSDIFSLGCVLFEMAAGTRPFHRETAPETMTAILREDPPELMSNGRAISPALDEVIRHCLEKRPEERFQSARDLAFALRALSGAQTTSGRSAVAAGIGSSPSRASGMTAVVAAVLALLVGVSLGWWISSSTGTPAARWAHFTQLTDEAGPEEAPVIAPDGDSIAYASKASGSWDIYVRRIGGRNATIVAGDPDRDESAPAFSPDGRTIAFHESDPNGGIFIVGATGESVRRVTEAGFHPAWSPDGRQLAFCDERIFDPASRTVTSALSIVDVATGDIRRLTEGDAVQPSWSPSGARLAYWAQTAGRRDIFTIAASGGEVVQVTDDGAMDWAPVWSPDGRHLYFGSDRGGAMNLWRIPIDESSGRPTGAPEPVTMGVQATSAVPSFSADGERLVFQSTLRSINPVAIPFDPTTEQTGEPSYLFRRTGNLVPTSISADGEWLAYTSLYETAEDIFVSRLDGSELRRLTDDPFRDRAPVWSPDGAVVTFYSNRSGSYEIWSVRRDGSGLSRLSDRPDRSLWFPFYEPSGDRVRAFDADRKAALILDLKRSSTAQAGEDVPVMEVEGGSFRAHVISRDGARLAGVAISPEGTLFGVGWHDLRSGRTVISTVESSPGMPAWLPDGRRFVYATSEHQLALIDAETGRRRLLGKLLPFQVQTQPPAISPDGRAIFVGASQVESDIWMVERVR